MRPVTAVWLSRSAGCSAKPPALENKGEAPARSPPWHRPEQDGNLAAAGRAGQRSFASSRATESRRFRPHFCRPVGGRPPWGARPCRRPTGRARRTGGGAGDQRGTGLARALIDPSAPPRRARQELVCPHSRAASDGGIIGRICDRARFVGRAAQCPAGPHGHCAGRAGRRVGSRRRARQRRGIDLGRGDHALAVTRAVAPATSPAAAAAPPNSTTRALSAPQLCSPPTTTAP